MVASPIRLALFAATAAATLANAAEITPFPVEYDALTYTLEYDVEVIASLTGDNAEINSLFDQFTAKFDESVASGGLTYADYDQRVSAFYEKADELVSSFSDKAIDEVSTRWLEAKIVFLIDMHAATWDLLSYGINAAHENVEDDMSIQIEKLESYMAQNVETADMEKLNEQLSLFYKAVADSAPTFQDDVDAVIFAKIAEVVEGQGGDAAEAATETSTEGSGSGEASTPSMAPTPTTTPTPTAEGESEGETGADSDATSNPTPTTSTPDETTPTSTTGAPSSQSTSAPAPTATPKSGAATLTIAASVLVAAVSSLLL